jgi:hypothetical protein
LVMLNRISRNLKLVNLMYFGDITAACARLLDGVTASTQRLTLNYDLAFLYVLLDALSSLPISGKRQRCIAHPLKKRFIIFSNKFAEYTSDMNIILMYYNLIDKWNDEKNLMGEPGL